MAFYEIYSKQWDSKQGHSEILMVSGGCRKWAISTHIHLLNMCGKSSLVVLAQQRKNRSVLTTTQVDVGLYQVGLNSGSPGKEEGRSFRERCVTSLKKSGRSLSTENSSHTHTHTHTLFAPLCRFSLTYLICLFSAHSVQLTPQINLFFFSLPYFSLFLVIFSFFNIWAKEKNKKRLSCWQMSCMEADVTSSWLKKWRIFRMYCWEVTEAKM